MEIGGESALETASGVTLLFISLLVVLYGSYTLLFKASAPTSARPLTSPDDYAGQLQQYKNVKVLKNDVLLALDQLERMEKKKSTLTRVLSTRFDPQELSYKKFSSVITEVEKLLLLNVRGIVNKLSLFDTTDFSLLANTNKPPQFSEKLVQKKTALYNDFFTSLKGYLGANEEILLKLDQLLLEISELDSTNYKEVEEMPCMQELSALIRQTKLYQ
ncbi:hypothetical protein [Paenibacillus ihuae]|uniref:hypothetical protein n=1 Tax=Paenibacillus ihuae TaxID=1232431 RepID=UPI000AD91901|nr:hypothetical protein [Paenibacillus ihuae]